MRPFEAEPWFMQTLAGTKSCPTHWSVQGHYYQHTQTSTAGSYAANVGDDENTIHVIVPSKEVITSLC